MAKDMHGSRLPCPLRGSLKRHAEDIKDWDDVRCPICMEHPHNAVLLLCASSDRGCRVFMCDTSYRHSNCFDQFRKLVSGAAGSQSRPSGLTACPLCRGTVRGWTVDAAARSYMNSKMRCCSTESCGFVGNYKALRRHARSEHPRVRPTVVDPEQQRNWSRMEQQRDLGDLLSNLHTSSREDASMPPRRASTRESSRRLRRRGTWEESDVLDGSSFPGFLSIDDACIDIDVGMWDQVERPYPPQRRTRRRTFRAYEDDYTP